MAYMQATIIILIITSLISLLLIKLLATLFVYDIKSIYCFFTKPFMRAKHYNKSDYNRAFNYLLKRNTVTSLDQKEERLFFLSLINEANSIKQLKLFTEQIKRFYKKKVKLINNRKFKNQREHHTQHYKEIVIFLIMAIKNRYEIINEFATFNDYHAFVKLLLRANEVSEIDAIVIFAEKLKTADYKKIKRLADQKKAIIQPHINLSEENSGFSMARIISHTFSSTIKYAVFSYLLLVFSSLALSLTIPILVTQADNKLLLVANTLKRQSFLPYFAKLNTPYFIIANNKIQFYKHPSFLQQQQKYYLTLLTNTLCKTATFSKVCHRNR